VSTLPPAFERLATVLELSSAFSLSFVTGPRDHVDSVYLRLVRALGGSHEFVRHRVDRDGVNLRAALGGGSGERPRVVFVSGLERMSDETRTDASARLNLVRDSWGPYPAQVIIWLPSWGLAEFRRLAPDLFDWRSSLTVLHDADLPVRNELEYLVWLCERLGRPAQGSGAEANQLQSVLWTTDRHPEAHVYGLDAAGRDWQIRDLAERLALARLAATCPHALDLLAPGVAASREPVPLALRAVDVAGRLGAAGWDSLARAAGIPHAPEFPDLLATLAQRGELVVMINGPDLLDTSKPWLDWLDATYPQLPRLLLFAQGGPPSAPQAARPGHADPARTGLEGLLAELFPREHDVREAARYLFEQDVADELPKDRTIERLIDDWIGAGERRGMIDRHFFDELKRIRPRLADRIDEVARAYLRNQ
jgi:hypothetical protein